ncbi:MAG: hypothetical protein QM530_01140 [Phycisphaerales bacterium]|nr:hypothetical protein [Phycisphaerales bacterium]
MDFKELILKEYEVLKDWYPKLEMPSFGKYYCSIKGVVDLIDINGNKWDTYSIEIKIPPTYPKEIPILLETQGKIPRDIDWHIVNKEGICCLGTDSKIYRELQNKITIENWFKKFGYSFLANHRYRAETGKYANGYYRHFNDGIVDDYKELFRLNSKEEVVTYIKYILGKKTKSLNTNCFCGSNKLYKRCYLLYKEKHFHNIPEFIYEKDLKKLQ